MRGGFTPPQFSSSSLHLLLETIFSNIPNVQKMIRKVYPGFCNANSIMISPFNLDSPQDIKLKINKNIAGCIYTISYKSMHYIIFSFEIQYNSVY